MKRIIKSLLLSCLLSVLTINPTFAQLNSDTLKFYSKNNILYYNPTGMNCIPAGTISFSIGEVSEEAKIILESSNITENVQQNISIYQYAATQTGLPWQVIATLHYREKNNEPGTSVLNGQKINSTGYYNVDGQWVDPDPNKDAVNAGNHLISMGKMVYGVDLLNNPSAEDYAKAFLAYNRGFIYKNANYNWDTSPYVANYIDDTHKAMTFPNIPGETVAGQQETGRVGAIVALAYFGGLSSISSSTSTSTIDGSNITIIGDSITFASLSALQSKLPQADISAEIGRTFDTGIKIAANPTLESSYNFNASAQDNGQLKDSLRKNVVFALGSNSTLTEKKIQEAISTIGSDKNIYFVTNYATSDGTYSDHISIYENNNNLFNNITSPNITVIDWAKSVQSGNFLSSDGLHPNSEGQKLFAELIYNALNKTTGVNICNPSSGIPLADGDIPWWSQIDAPYGGTYFGSQGYPATSGNRASVSSSACAVFSMASIISLLTHKTVEPKTLLNWVGQENTYRKDYDEGYTNITTTFKNTYAKHFPGLTYTSIKNTTGQAGGNFSSFKSQIETALKSGKYIIVAGQGDSSTTPYSSGGHFIVIRGIAADGNWLIINSGSDGHEDTFEKTHDPKVLWQYAYTAGIISL